MGDGISGFAAIGALLLTVIVQAVGVFRHIATVKEGLQEQIAATERVGNDKLIALERLFAERIETTQKECRLLVEKLAESESKSRHDLANNMTAGLGEFRRDLKAVEGTVGTVQRDMITRADISDLKQDIKSEFDRNERTRNEAMDRFEKRFTDALARRE